MKHFALLWVYFLVLLGQMLTQNLGKMPHPPIFTHPVFIFTHKPSSVLALPSFLYVVKVQMFTIGLLQFRNIPCYDHCTLYLVPSESKENYTCLISHNTASIVSNLTIRLGLDR